MIGLAALLLVHATTGCSGDGRSVRCTLAPPVRAAPAVVAIEEPARPVTRRRPAVRRHRAITPPPPPGDADIARHVAALVTIGDCTGVRTYLGSAGKPADAVAAFDACVTAPRPMPQPIEARR